MKPSHAWVLSGLQSVLAIALGVIAVMIVNLAAASIVEPLFPGSLTPDGIPLTAAAQLLYLPILFLAGMAGAFAVVFAAPRAPVVHALVFGVLAIAGDLFVVVDYAGIWPLWFSALVVLTVPPQVWLGAVLGLRVRRRWVRGYGPAWTPPLRLCRSSLRHGHEEIIHENRPKGRSVRPIAIRADRVRASLDRGRHERCRGGGPAIHGRLRSGDGRTVSTPGRPLILLGRERFLVYDSIVEHFQEARSTARTGRTTS